MGLEEWLCRILTEKRAEDRMKIFREWRRLNLRIGFKKEPTDQELEEEIKFIRERKFGPGNYTFGYADSLIDFVPEFHKQNRIKRARTAATKRWSKKSDKKSLV
jgi:hypothetical protein